MIATCFVDTNVLVYARDASEPEKQVRALEWVKHLWQLRTGRLSIQVLEEFYVTVTGKLRPGMPRQEAEREVRDLLAWQPVALDASLLERAFMVQGSFALSFWDAMIVGAAQVAECRYLLSEDLQDGQDLHGVQVVNPFHHEPASRLL